MAKGNAERMWTFDEYVEKYEKLEAELRAWRGRAEEYHNQYHLCKAKLLSHKSIIKQFQTEVKRLKDLFRELETTATTRIPDWALEIVRLALFEEQKVE